MNIDKGFPVPELGDRKGGRGRPAVYPFHKMAVGDSFSVPLESRNKATGAASLYAKTNGGKFSSKTMGDKTVRIWRIE